MEPDAANETPAADQQREESTQCNPNADAVLVEEGANQSVTNTPRSSGAHTPQPQAVRPSAAPSSKQLSVKSKFCSANLTVRLDCGTLECLHFLL